VAPFHLDLAWLHCELLIQSQVCPQFLLRDKMVQALGQGQNPHQTGAMSSLGALVKSIQFHIIQQDTEVGLLFAL